MPAADLEMGTAPKYCSPILNESFINPNRPAIPRVPRVTDFSALSTMGVELSSCTIAAALTLAWDHVFRNPQQAFRRYQVQATVFGVVTEW
jgi:hypothetical protein